MPASFIAKHVPKDSVFIGRVSTQDMVHPVIRSCHRKMNCTICGSDDTFQCIDCGVWWCFTCGHIWLTRQAEIKIESSSHTSGEKAK